MPSFSFSPFFQMCCSPCPPCPPWQKVPKGIHGCVNCYNFIIFTCYCSRCRRIIRYSSGTIVIAIRQKLRFRSRPKADWYFNHWSVFLVWSWSQSQGWIFCPKSKNFTYHRGQVLNFEQNIHPCDWDDDQTRNTLEWLKYQSAQGLDWKLNFCLIAITIGPEEYLNCSGAARRQCYTGCSSLKIKPRE